MMGDTSPTSGPTPTNEPEEAAADKESIQLLKETNELSDITKETPQSTAVADAQEEKSNKTVESGKSKSEEDHVETVYQSLNPIDTTTSSANASAIITSSEAGDVKDSCGPQMSSQSGRLNKLRDHASNIFPIGVMGCKDDDTLPSPRRLLDAHEASQDTIGHIENTPRKMMSVKLASEGSRNPVLGTGVQSDDEFRKGSNRKVDGNPVLGEGYNKNARLASGSSARIPPGGHSQGLW